jgi:hypothetical protein
MTKRLGGAAALVALALSACSDNVVHLQPGQSYSIRKDVGITPCPGVWGDYAKLDGPISNTERLRIVLNDGGTTLLGGDSFTVIGFGPGIDAPVRIRSHVNNALCWLPNEDIQQLITQT